VVGVAVGILLGFGGGASSVPSVPNGSGSGTRFGQILGTLRVTTTIYAHDVPGTVELIGGGHSFSRTAGTDGRFTMHLPAGTYKAVGSSPEFVAEDVRMPCASTGPVDVRPGSTSVITITCDGY
jgi:hypothetical protein